MPSAGSCIWEWKKSIFTTNKPGYEPHVGEISLPAVQNRIDAWLNANNYVPGDGEDEYGYFIENCIPIAEDRRRFFQDWIKLAKPHVGYKLLGLLAESEIIRSVWTTNFDQLVPRAATERNLAVIEVGIDTSERAFRHPDRGELVHVALHGDYRYDRLMNTSDELKQQDATLRHALIDQLKHQSLIVLGYSGRDASIMEALRAALTQGNTTGRIYWCGFSDQPSEEVASLLQDAGDAGCDAYFVPGAAFDDVMVRLSLHCLSDGHLDTASQYISGLSTKNSPRKAFALPEAQTSTLVKSNAWPIALPEEMFQFELKSWPTEAVWATIVNRTEGLNVVAVPYKQCVLALGTLESIKDCFGDEIKGAIKRVPITQDDIKYEDGAVISMLRHALVCSMSKSHSLETDRQRRLWERKPLKSERDCGQIFSMHRCASIALRKIDQRYFFVVDPTIQVCGDPEPSKETVGKLRNRILGYQHNDKFNNDLKLWSRKLLTRGGSTEYDYPNKTGAFKFSIKQAPIFASISNRRERALKLPDGITKYITHTGIEVPETRLLFGSTNGDPASDTLPLRGLSGNGPYDFDRSVGSHNEARIGVICPRAEAAMLSSFLSDIQRQHSPPKGTKEDYMVPFNGFSPVYRIPINFPSKGAQGWHFTPEPDTSLNNQQGSLELSRLVRSGVDSLKAGGFNQVLIFTPERWKQWRGFENEKESFDLHDFVKAYCVQRGVATQFLDQDTLGYPDKCRLWWWLSTALYAKSMRTPWVLEGLDTDTAYVGLGYGFDRKAERGKQIVLGCSHLYNAQGQGLQFRLSQIEDPIVHGRNPFLRVEDARRMGESIRQLYWEAHLKLPRRVVIHKLTPFLRSEQEGLRVGLAGISEVDLLEINYEPSLRYLSSIPDGEGFREGNYPVRRGTTIKLSAYEALLWIHGATEAVNPRWTYYQGKRRIPAPIVLRRYSGSTDLATLCSEILGLSKMDWNSGDLYAKLPATVLSSKKIAKIGSLLERFGNVTYDYRLFM